MVLKHLFLLGFSCRFFFEQWEVLSQFSGEDRGALEGYRNPFFIAKAEQTYVTWALGWGKFRRPDHHRQVHQHGTASQQKSRLKHQGHMGSFFLPKYKHPLLEINISHLGKRKIIFKYALSGGYVNSLEGIHHFPFPADHFWVNDCHPIDDFLAFFFYKYMGVSKNSGTPKWMVYNGNPY